MIGVAMISITVVPALIPTFIRAGCGAKKTTRSSAASSNLQAAADLGLAAPEPGDVDVRRPVDPGGRHVSLAGDLRPRCLRNRLADHFLAPCSALVAALTVILGARLLLAGVCRCSSLVLIGLWAYHFTRSGWRSCRRLDEARRSTCRSPSPGQRHPSGRRSQSPRCPDPRLSGSGVGHRQGRPGRHAHRSRAAGHGRDVRQLPAQGALAKRVLQFADAANSRGARALIEGGAFWARAATDEDRKNLINDATPKGPRAVRRNDPRAGILRYQELERELEPELTRLAITDTMRPADPAGRIKDGGPAYNRKPS